MFSQYIYFKSFYNFFVYVEYCILTGAFFFVLKRAGVPKGVILAIGITLLSLVVVFATSDVIYCAEQAAEQVVPLSESTFHVQANYTGSAAQMRQDFTNLVMPYVERGTIAWATWNGAKYGWTRTPGGPVTKFFGSVSLGLGSGIAASSVSLFNTDMRSNTSPNSNPSTSFTNSSNNANPTR